MALYDTFKAEWIEIQQQIVGANNNDPANARVWVSVFFKDFVVTARMLKFLGCR